MSSSSAARTLVVLALALGAPLARAEAASLSPPAPAPSAAKAAPLTPSALPAKTPIPAKAGTPTKAAKPTRAGQPTKAAKLTTKVGAKPPRAKGPKVPKTTTVVLFHVNRHDTLALRQRDAQGRPVKGQQKRFDRFLRCHYTNKQHAMNPRLVRLLYQTGHHWPGKRVEVVSGYRSPTVAKNPHSPHMQGLACDFRVAGVKNTELRDYLRKNLKKVGVGYYPNSSFVHLDVRKDRSAFWIDYSGPGERAMYSQSPSEDLKTGRAEQYHPTKIGDDWLE
jgi:uncharacterized protein YcbK (DUF882 family)